MLNDLPELKYHGKPALPPQKDDLERLYRLIIEHRATTVLEFGCGYSTFVIGKALQENQDWYDALPIKPAVRRDLLFVGHSVETDREWLTHCMSQGGSRIFHYHVSCKAGYHNDQMCHFYDALPPVIPDFIYLDGPDPNQVIGGPWAECQEATPMAADILRMEPLLIPGTVVVIDGRVNNARFLQRNLQWNWKVRMEDDVTIMELDEPRLGKINVTGRDILEALGEN